MTERYYAGIGSRETPAIMMEFITTIARYLDHEGWTLRSGAAAGADTAFEAGATRKQIFVPWNGFSSRRAEYPVPTRAYEIVAHVHPGFFRLTAGAQKLHARNVQQVLGPNLDSPSAFVLCWTPDGCEDEGQRTRQTGGTATAIVLANRQGIPVFNMQRGAESYGRFQAFLERQAC